MKGKQLVWRLPGERYNPECIIATVKHDEKVNVWGCFCGNGVGKLYWIKDILYKKEYVQILQTQMLPSAARLLGGQNWLFQQDNDPKHTAIVSRNWIRDNCVNVLEWPPQSLDLNPIENLWGVLDFKLKTRRPTSKQDLFNILRQGWEALNVELLRNLADSMPRRLEAVIKANGWQTKY